MTNQQLIDFIKKQLQLNVPKDKITGELLANGWNNQDITEGFTAVMASKESIPPVIPKEITPDHSFDQDRVTVEREPVAQPIIKEQAPVLENTKLKSHLGRKIFFIVLFLLLLAGGAAAYYFKDEIMKLPIISDFFPEEALAPEDVISDVVSPDVTQTEVGDQMQGGEMDNSNDKKLLEDYLATYKGNIALKIVNGIATKDDTVCKDQSMFVVSAHDSILTEGSLGRKINIDGSFTTIVSKDGPQLLMLINDKEEVCLSAMSFPNNNNPIVFNTESTIISTLMVTDENDYLKIKELKSFAPFYQFMQKTLKIKTMENISSELLEGNESSEYLSLLSTLMNEAISILESNQFYATKAKLTLDQVKDPVSYTRADAEIYFNKNGSYKDVCKTAFSESINKLKQITGETYICFDSKESYAFSASFNAGNFYCADSSGFVAEIKNQITGPKCQ